MAQGEGEEGDDDGESPDPEELSEKIKQVSQLLDKSL